jgi:hypothetical protein
MYSQISQTSAANLAKYVTGTFSLWRPPSSPAAVVTIVVDAAFFPSALQMLVSSGHVVNMTGYLPPPPVPGTQPAAKHTWLVMGTPDGWYVLRGR